MQLKWIVARSRSRLGLYVTAWLVTFVFAGSATAADIASVYAGLPANIGTVVTVEAYYTTPDDNKIVSDYDLFLEDEPMPPFSVILLDGPTAPPAAWYGGFVSVTGQVDTLAVDFDPDPINPQTVILRNISYSVLRATESERLDQGSLFREHDLGFPSAAACDSCKFAILISGGINEANNHARYWNNLEMLYKLKVDSLGYCPQNVFTLYYKGDSGNTAVIPNAAVDSCTLAKVQQAHNTVAERVAECRRKGKKSELQILVTNHGRSNGDIYMLGWNDRLTPAGLRSMIQTVIDSCLADLNVEMVQCYGGAPADSLKSLDDKKKTTMNVSSAAGGSDKHRSTADNATYLKVKVDSLLAGTDYEDAVRGGLAEYDSLLRREGLEGRRGHSVHWRSYPMKDYCSWTKVEVPLGGQLCLEFTGDARSCGNVTVYEEQPNGSKKKVAIWNWNVPGSTGYLPGNERRVINVAATSTGRFWIHNDDPFANTYFRLKVISKQTRPLPESPTNLPAMAGHSNGANDDSPNEFGITLAPQIFVPNVDQPGTNLQNLPRSISPSGTWGLATSFSNPLAPGSDHMELYLDIYSVEQPGNLIVDASSDLGIIPVAINEPGVYIVPLGNVLGNTLVFNPPSAFDPLTAASFTFDAWGMRIEDLATDTEDLVAPPRQVRIFPSYPNPFNPVNTLVFEIPRAGYVRVDVYDPKGRRVRTVLDEYRLPGRHAVNWNGRDDAGREVAAGAYFWRLQAGNLTRTTKMILVK